MGTLYVVGTPIGNLEDMTLRAVRILGEVDVIACEDTRRTRVLLERHGISTPLISYHEHNERRRAGELVRRLTDGEDVALVTDAGMPTVSDPGFHLVAQALEAGVPVVPVPGPSAVTAALSVSGLPSDRFLFLGFLPRTRAARRRALEEVAALTATLVLFEGPHRIAETLEDVLAILGPRRVALVREATKLHEEVRRGRADQLAAMVAGGPLRGEITLVVEGSAEARTGTRNSREGTADLDAHLRRLLGAGMSRRDAARSLSEAYGIPRREAYRMATEGKRR
ncbi:MAG TPA: 16S rRNA (cytidine(1402)-2'-O)-methyltransferase [bacterium]|jgi:16S rRNA (cytidine1402-2'-O)-methyltransferase|nr:16S rRNA (cytidine(1402)-2'-O)-methyltransferase [bacterium]